MDGPYDDDMEMEDGNESNNFDQDGSLGQIGQSSVSGDPDQDRKIKKLRKKMRKNIIKKTEANPDPYKDKKLDKEDFLKKVQQDLRKLSAAGDPKGLRQMQKLSDQQLKMLKDEQLRQVYDEREVLKTQAEEVKRLEWLNKKLNHSYGLKNRH